MSTKKATSSDIVQVEQKSFGMPQRTGFTVAHFRTVADIDRSARWYAKVFDGRILSSGDSDGAPAYIQFANTWLLVNVGGGPTPDKPTVTLSVPNPDKINSFMNIRVADIHACYDLWKSRGAEFITKPIPKYGETNTCFTPGQVNDRHGADRPRQTSQAGRDNFAVLITPSCHEETSPFFANAVTAYRAFL